MFEKVLGSYSLNGTQGCHYIGPARLLHHTTEMLKQFYVREWMWVDSQSGCVSRHEVVEVQEWFGHPRALSLFSARDGSAHARRSREVILSRPELGLGSIFEVHTSPHLLCEIQHSNRTCFSLACPYSMIIMRDV